jgi:hypothetical protein
LRLNEQQIRRIKHPNALFYELTVAEDGVNVQHYLADLCGDGPKFEHGGIALDGICEELPPQAVSGE